MVNDKHEAVTAGRVIDALLRNKAWRAVKYLAPNLVVRATQTLQDRKIARKGSNADLRVTIGRPNYRERDFIKAAKKAGETFPIGKVQLQFPPKPKAKAKKGKRK